MKSYMGLFLFFCILHVIAVLGQSRSSSGNSGEGNSGEGKSGGEAGINLSGSSDGSKTGFQLGSSGGLSNLVGNVFGGRDGANNQEVKGGKSGAGGLGGGSGGGLGGGLGGEGGGKSGGGIHFSGSKNGLQIGLGGVGGGLSGLIKNMFGDSDGSGEGKGGGGIGGGISGAGGLGGGKSGAGGGKSGAGGGKSGAGGLGGGKSGAGGKGGGKGKGGGSGGVNGKGGASLSVSFGLGSALGNFVDGISGRFSSIGNGVEDGIKKLLSAIPGGSIDLDNGGGSGGSLHASLTSNVNTQSIIKRIFESPLRLVRGMFRIVVNFFWSILTLQFKVIKIPLTVVSKVVSIIRTIVTAVVTRILNVVLKIQSINVEVVSKGIGVGKSILGFIVSTLASVEISQIKAVTGIIGFTRGRVIVVIKTIFSTMKNILKGGRKLVSGGLKTFKLDKIPRLPIIRNIIGAGSGGFNAVMTIVFKQLIELSQFVDKIIYEHQDFFIPIFQKILNTLLAVRDAANRIIDGGGHSGIMATLGNLRIVLAPLTNGAWQWTGLDGITYHGSLSMNAICKKYGTPQVVPGPLYSGGGDCSGGPQESAGTALGGGQSVSNPR